MIFKIGLKIFNGVWKENFGVDQNWGFCQTPASGPISCLVFKHGGGVGDRAYKKNVTIIFSCVNRRGEVELGFRKCLDGVQVLIGCDQGG